eukprot:gene9671-13021_t
MRTNGFIPILKPFTKRVISKSNYTKNISKFQSQSTKSDGGIYNSFLNIPIHLRSLNDIVHKYDVFVLDQFGVLHNGQTPLPKISETLSILNQHNKIIIILSNASNLVAKASQRFTDMGLPPVYTTFVTSGSVAYDFIASKAYKKCVWFTWKTHTTDDYLSKLNVQSVNIDDENVDFLFFHGTQVIANNHIQYQPDTTDYLDHKMPSYYTGEVDDHTKEIFRKAIKRNIPAICANIDIKAIVGNNKPAYMPGIYLECFKSMGGQLVSFGKPHKEFFNLAINKAIDKVNSSNIPSNANVKIGGKNRIVHVGDSLHHDIQGAIETGIDSILITAHGIHKDELNDDRIAQNEVDKPLLIKVTDLCDREGVGRPDYIMTDFIF